MSVLYLDPSGDVSSGWNVINPASPTTHYDKINSATRQPTTPQTTNYVRATTTGSSVRVDEYSMGSATGVASVSQVVIWAYCLIGIPFLDKRIECDIKKLGGSYIGLQILSSRSGGALWKSVTFAGLNWTQSELNGMTVKLQARKPSGKVSGTFTIYEMYAEVTYTAGSTAVPVRVPLPMLLGIS